MMYQSALTPTKHDEKLDGLLHRLQSFFGDPVIVLLVIVLSSLGLLMVTSASVAVAEERLGSQLYYFWHQLIYLGLGAMAGIFVLCLPLKIWYRHSHILLLMGLLLLIAVLIPGVGRTVNGSTRWINLGFMAVQVSEIAKLLFVVYMASYLARFHRQVRTEWQGFIKPMIVLSCMAVLLLLEPDFGATVVISTTCMVMLYLAGVRWRVFLLMLASMVVLFSMLALAAPYRVKRLVSFMDPWQDQFNSGYQLSQALIAFGQGGWFGTGLGKSVQKLFYLPEAHTDFVFAVIAEELGLVGVFVIIALFITLYTRLFQLAQRALMARQLFCGFLVYGITAWFALQTFISMGVNTGLLPTKGLTLPFISYGGSSLVINLMTIALVLRVAKRVNHPQQQMDNLP